MEAMPEKQHAHQLIDQLPDSQIETAVRFLEFMLLDPVARAAATAPPDDEPVTEEDRRRFHDGQAWFRQHDGKGAPMEEFYLGAGLDRLAETQKVKPLRNPAVLTGAIPADQDVDRFLEEIYSARK